MQVEDLFKKLRPDIETYEVNLQAASDKELLDVSNRMGLALALPEMKRIKEYFGKQGRNPTDIELQALGQAWSEHCCYKSSKVPLKKFVFNVDEKRIVAREDAGVMEFDKDHYYCVALESHNHPSAIEPYGGAATGVGGIVRDVLCIDGMEYLFIKNSGQEKTIMIGEYIEKLSKNKNHLNSDIIELSTSTPLEILSFDNRTNEPCYSKVRKLYKRKASRVLEIKFNKGRSLIVTPDHSMTVISNDNFVTKSASELQPGNKIPLLTSLPHQESQELRIDLLDELEKRGYLDVTVNPEQKIFLQYRRQFDEFLKKIGISTITRCNYFSGNYIPLKLYLDLEKHCNIPLNREDLRIHAYKGRGYFPAVIKVDEDFSRLVGYYIAEGYMRKDARGNTWVQWSFNQHEKEYIDDVCKILDKFGLKYSIWVSPEFASLSITVNSRMLGFLFSTVLGCGSNSYEQRIPSIFFKLPKNLQVELLKGIMRGDGDIKISKRMDRKNSYRIKIRYGTVSLILAQQVCILLQSFGYIPLSYEQFTKKSKNFLTVFEICKIDDAKRLGNLFSKKDKRNIEKYFGKIKQGFLKDHKPINSLLIKEIKNIEGSHYVYDMTVDSTHLFVTSSGIITHNCMGAQPIAYIDPLFFGPLDTPFEKLPKGVKHPVYLFKGVVDGIRDYGNRIGIPTLAGQVCFHEGYTGNCLVNVGCVGIMKKSELVHSWAKAPGNIYIYVGGKTGRDGIHGVNFASAELTDESEESSRSAVQVGDPITKEPVIHACLECNRKGLLEGFKDFGGGGLSCVSGELAYSANMGAEIHLDNVPLKEEGLKPWEIWVSESQERMMMLVKPENVDTVLHICKQWDVTAAVVGKVIKDQIIRVFYKGQKLLEMNLEFMTGGPVYDSCARPFIIPKKTKAEKSFPLPDLNEVLQKLLSSLNIASKEWVIRQYDHEVRGGTVIKPLQGKVGLETHGDATVMKPLDNSWKGIAVTADVNPLFMACDPYWGAMSAVDEACRNLVSVGATPDSLLDCLNFGNPEKPERMGEFYESCRGLGDIGRALNLPYVSGNVSFYNESAKTAVPPTPQIFGVGLVDDIRTCVTSDFKTAGNPVYLIGKHTEKELGGSEYYHLMKVEGGTVPRTDPSVLQKAMQGLLSCMKKGYVAACHDVSEGGIGVCLAEMAIGGDVGAVVDVSSLTGDLRADLAVFSESNTRWVVEVKKDMQDEVEKLLKKEHIMFNLLGTAKGKNLVIQDSKKIVVDLPMHVLRECWSKPLWKFMG